MLIPKLPKDFLCCAGWDFVCPGTSKVARLDRNEGTKMHLTKLFFFCLFLSFLSISSFFHFYHSYHFPTFSFLKPQPIRAIILKCDGSVYHKDVDITYEVPCYTCNTRAKKRRPPQLTYYTENKYRHEHVMMKMYVHNLV